MEAFSNISQPHPERRQFPRLKVSTPIQFRSVLKPHDQYSGSLSRDLSIAGIRLTVSTFLPKETRLLLTLTLPALTLPDSENPIRVIGRVAWIEQHPFSDDLYDIGIQFVEFSPEDQQAIARYIDEISLSHPERLSKIQSAPFASLL